MLPVAILAGGMATRLRPITETIPKSLVEVAGRPFIFHQLGWLRDEGVKSVVLCVGHLGARIADVVGNGAAFGVSVEYSFDGDKLLGTGGALKKAMPQLGDACFVLYGDSFLCCSFAEAQAAFTKAGKSALMTVLKNEGQWDISNVIFRGGQVIRYDKQNPVSEMRHIDYGLSVVQCAVFTAYPVDEAFDLADIFVELSSLGQLAGLEVHERFYEIGSYDGLRETEEFLQRKGK
jgi:MurNAc alpha-1-phosphate uridylyltransferase